VSDDVYDAGDTLATGNKHIMVVLRRLTLLQNIGVDLLHRRMKYPG